MFEIVATITGSVPEGFEPFPQAGFKQTPSLVILIVWSIGGNDTRHNPCPCIQIKH